MYNVKNYPISSFNQYACLKPNALMAIITLYLLKPFLIAASSVVYKGDSSSLINLFYTNKLTISLEAAATIPVFFLLFAWTRRAPGATKLVQYIWRNGKILIITTAFLQLCVTSSPLWLPVRSIMTRSSWLQLLLYISIIITTILSTYMRDCFADFPEYNQEDI